MFLPFHQHRRSGKPATRQALPCRCNRCKFRILDTTPAVAGCLLLLTRIAATGRAGGASLQPASTNLASGKFRPPHPLIQLPPRITHRGFPSILGHSEPRPTTRTLAGSQLRWCIGILRKAAEQSDDAEIFTWLASSSDRSRNTPTLHQHKAKGHKAEMSKRLKAAMLRAPTHGEHQTARSQRG